MLHIHKNYLFLFIVTASSLLADPMLEIKDSKDAIKSNPYNFIDSNAQRMVKVLTEQSDLFETDRTQYEQKIKDIFEPMIDFKRVAASVMGRKYYLLATKEQREEFVEIFKDSLLDTYAETLAQWGDSKIRTEFNDGYSNSELKNVEVKQVLDTGNSKYPISYKLRKNDKDWKIVNIIINGVNLGLTFRNQFQALAVSHNDDIEATLSNWISDAGDAGIS
ncbi:MAG: toluene tolerance protein [Gammaproteobacteria bacterium]|jgi:phospholipid transport system substrate-binding protein|nr:toluene tolerance protein [Gammaproteobacteria bacterium]|tara:strand:- start:15612 stop:16271 length:660 start_codon:yes stop_codon:yes gene_type:complete